MTTKRCLNQVHREDLFENDRAELDAFTRYLHLVNQATHAGVARVDAERSIYSDVYDDASTPNEVVT